MNLIFDFDGTIADGLDTAIEVVNKYLNKKGQPPVTKKEIRTQGVEALIKKRKISKLTIFFALIQARREIAKHIKDIEIFPGLATVLRKLSHKHTLGIISSNSTKNIEYFLKKHNLESCFSFVLSERSLFGKDKKIKKIIARNKLNQAQTFYIGDEGRDITAAKKAGVTSVAVTWGFEGRKVLKKYNPDKMVDTPLELSDLFL